MEPSKEILPTEVKNGWTISSVLVARPGSARTPITTVADRRAAHLQGVIRALSPSRGGLRKLGVERGDKVAFMLPNSMEIVLSWFAVNLLAAVEVPINIHYKGSWLVHEVNDCAARLAIVHEQYIERFVEVAELEHLTDLIVVCGDAPRITEGKWSMHTWGELEKAEALEEPVETRYHDTSGILYTSGTTGPSKGVVLPYGVGGNFAQGIIEVAKLTSDDVSYVVHPLFHGNAQFMQVLPSLLVGARVSLWPGFSASRWLEQVSLRRDDNQRYRRDLQFRL